MKCQLALDLGQVDRLKTDTLSGAMLKSVEVVATQFVGPVVLFARDVADLQGNAFGMSPRSDCFEEVAQGPGGCEQLVEAGFGSGVVATGGQAELVMAMLHQAVRSLQ